MPSLSKHPDQRKCKLNHPRLIELLSNAAFHEAEELVKDNNNHKIHKSEIKFVKNKILSFIIVNKLVEFQKFNLQKPDKENVKDIIGYQ